MAGVRVSQISLEFVVPFAGAAPVVPQSVVIQLIGWKLYPDALCDDAVPGLEPPSVERAV
jgi:hypothetical protein